MREDKEKQMAEISKQKIKVLNKLFGAGISSEKDILALGLSQIASMQNISKPEISVICELQNAIKANRVISFLCDSEEK